MPKKQLKTDPNQQEFQFQHPTSEEKNKYEEVIDAMMNSEVLERKPQLKEILERTYRNRFEKRQTILAALDNDRQLFTTINRKIGERPRLEIVTEIVEMLRKYVQVGETERKLYGEVMTPISLVEEMLDQLPEEVWTNPNLKWLDPANGCGIFPAVIIQRLMQRLADWQPDEDKRYKHIVENMIHVCELQPKNMFLYLCAFDPKDKYAMNIFTGSFLTEDFNKHSKEIWGVDKFDVIVGNPPYQDASGNKGKGHTLWDKFVEKSIYLLNPKSFLTTIHPAGWRNIDGTFKTIQKRILENQLLKLSLHSEIEGQSTFNAFTAYDHYTLQKTPPKTPTIIRSHNGELTPIFLSGKQFIPNGSFEKFEQLIGKSKEECTKVLNSRSAYGGDKKHVSKERNGEFIHPCIYCINKGDKVRLFYTSKTSNGHFGIPKMIWSNGYIPSFGTLVDQKGEYGMTQWCSAIVDEPRNLENIKKAFDSQEFRRIMADCKIGTNSVNPKIVALLRKDFWKEFINDETQTQLSN